MTPERPNRSLCRFLIAGLVALVLTGAPVAMAGKASPTGARAPQSTLQPFASEQDLTRFLKARQVQPETRGPGMGGPAVKAVEFLMATSNATATTVAESITNTQEAGVDEGGIVKMRGDILVVLRRGRLFTISTRNGKLRPLDSVEAFPPGVDPQRDWYDEMLITGNRVVVIGFSYARGGTEINRFRIDDNGTLSFEDSHHLKSDDYYSSRNYASRLIGTRLVVYTPFYLPRDAADSRGWVPGLRRWKGAADKGGFEPIASAPQIYAPPSLHRSPSMSSAFHSVTECDLAARRLTCTSTGALGPAGRTFYVSQKAVYVWLLQPPLGGANSGSADAMLYRLPLDRSAPSAMRVRGAPTDQFSFREDWSEGLLHVLLRGEGGGDAMWNPEITAGTVSLLRVSLRDFNDGDQEAPRRAYRIMPHPASDGLAFQNRFVGDFVLYGTGAGWGGDDGPSTLVAANVRGGSFSIIPLPHSVDRIEAMGRDAVVIGSDGESLHFRAVELINGGRPQLGDAYNMDGFAQGETRSHAFFFKPETPSNALLPDAGVIGLPVTRGDQPQYGQLPKSSAAITFLRRSAGKFSRLGELGAREEADTDDGCQASCVDWYGNSRPIFVGNRTFALMGYEIVEGEVGPRSIRETRRVSFAPKRR
jgi:hypothetical protein